MNKQELETVAHKLVSEAKGILAADESLPTIKKRFDTIQVESTEENRRAYRECCFQPREWKILSSGKMQRGCTLWQI